MDLKYINNMDLPQLETLLLLMRTQVVVLLNKYSFHDTSLASVGTEYDVMPMVTMFATSLKAARIPMGTPFMIISIQMTITTAFQRAPSLAMQTLWSTPI